MSFDRRELKVTPARVRAINARVIADGSPHAGVALKPTPTSPAKVDHGAVDTTLATVGLIETTTLAEAGSNSLVQGGDGGS